MPEFVTICEQAARSAGSQLLAWSDRFRVTEKGPADFVTDADLAAERAARRSILATFPSHRIIAEEGVGSANSTGDSEYVWYVDPLDGTTNYVHRLPHYCVSVAVARRGEILAGAVYCPPNGDLYTASEGGGAFLNGRRLGTSTVSCLSDALVAASFPPKIGRGSPYVEVLAGLLSESQSIRRMGSAALNLCFLAAGRFDAYWAPPTINSWDVAAGVLLIREAGGVVSAIDGTPFSLENPPLVAACNEKVHQELIRLLQRPDA